MSPRANREILKYLRTIAKKGGSATSEAKARAARENGKLGGRPVGSTTKRRKKAAPKGARKPQP